jgi:hypothetical protein
MSLPTTCIAVAVAGFLSAVGPGQSVSAHASEPIAKASDAAALNVSAQTRAKKRRKTPKATQRTRKKQAPKQTSRPAGGSPSQQRPDPPTGGY